MASLIKKNVLKKKIELVIIGKLPSLLWPLSCASDTEMRSRHPSRTKAFTCTPSAGQANTHKHTHTQTDTHAALTCRG